MPHLCKFYPGIWLTTEEKAWKNLSQGSRRVLVYILPKHTHYKTHTNTHPHITKQFLTTTVQVKINTIQDIPKWNSHNIIKYPQHKFNGTFIHKNFTVTHFTSLHFTSLHSLTLMTGPTPCISLLSSQLTVDSNVSLSKSSSSSAALIMIPPWRCRSRALYSCTFLPQL